MSNSIKGLSIPVSQWNEITTFPESNYDVWGYWKATNENYSDHQAKCHYDHTGGKWYPEPRHHELTHWRKDFPEFEKP